MGQTTKQSHAETETLILHFGTKPHELDAKTLLESLGGIEAALTGISRHGHPSTNLRIKVKAFQPGSFEVPIEVQQWVAPTALAVLSLNWDGTKEGIKIFLELIKLKMELKGKEPKAVRHHGDKVEIKGNKGPVTIDQRTYNIYVNDKSIDDALAKGFKALEEDTEVKSFKVLSKQKENLLDVPRRSFPYISKSKKEKSDDSKAITERLQLPIFKAVFDKPFKWEFYYRGATKISATIADEDFVSRIKGGERFGCGDTLDVDLEIGKALDKKLKMLVNKSYTILHVYGIQRRPEQTNLA